MRGFKFRAYTQNYSDYDYLHKLNNEEYLFLKKFSNSYYGDAHRNGLYTQPEQKRQASKSNYARRYDLMSAKNNEDFDIEEVLTEQISPENAFILLIDHKKKALG